ncbi:MAG TPA: hypothetical protein VHO67_17175 [Polyangia bacterium]|nr:hypothetical protein [Polyangia bacterium]
MSTGDRIYRSDLQTGGPNLSPLGLAIGCLWVAWAFAVLIFTLSARHQFKPVVLADEMAISDRAMAPERAGR